MRGKNYEESLKNPVSEIWVDFGKPMLLNSSGHIDGHRKIDGFFSFGGKTTPKELGLALEDFALFLQSLEDDTDYADYDEGDMCAGFRRGSYNLTHKR